jgi:hypothetical protein
MKDSVFEGVLTDLPVSATNIVIEVSYSYKVADGTHKGSVQKFFPSKAEATFRRESAKAEGDIKKVIKDTQQAVELIKGLEDRIHKRISKLERKNDPDNANVS